MKWINIIALLFVCTVATAQQTYNLSNMTAYDCYGILYDSDEGDNDTYDHNEDLIFKICVPGASSITIDFDSFCTEPDEDYLIIYDGSDTTASKMAKLSGSTSPGSYTSSGGCLTFYFHSDKSVSCFGWKIIWEAEIEPPQAPRFLYQPDVSCESTSFGVRFDQKLNCDSVRDSSFLVTGVLLPQIASITPVNCDGNNETDSFIINLDRPLDRGGSYRVDFTYVYYDACDSPWVLDTFVYFNINDCPIEVDLTLDDDTICLGACTYLNVDITGGDSLNYVYYWDPSAPSGSEPYLVCPTTTTKYKLRVEDGVSLPGSDSIVLTVLNPPRAMNDTTVCIYSGPFTLTANPAGGTWQGKGVDTINAGRYVPLQAGAGLDTVVYSINGCMDTVLIFVRYVWAGYDNASCPGNGPFYVNGQSPAGGFWTGSYIDSNGLFSPPDTGSFRVTYNWNGCSHSKNVNIYPISVPMFDTFCLSDPVQVLPFTPFGGRWYGRGIVNSVYGYFNPLVAGAGDHLLQYWINGCRDTMYVHVISIDARYNEISCPDEGPIIIVPAIPSGGYWTGVGITDSLTGEYDASFVYGLNRLTYNDTLRYHLNGCVDFKIMYVRPTRIYKDTLKFCIEDNPIYLDWWSVQSTPGGGRWTGPGTSGYYFYPAIAGYGTHTIYYDANGCGDSIVMVIYPESIIQSDTDFCITDPTFNLYNEQGTGYWSGPGIIDQANGSFRPASAGIGAHTVFYYSEYGCKDSITVTVYGLPVVTIDPLDPFYCLKDSMFLLTANPAGGTWMGPGIAGNQFNPRNAGSGNHQLFYTYGRTGCSTTESVTARVNDTLRVNALADKDTICEGEDVILSASGNGGVAAGYYFSWSSGESNTTTLIKSPSASTRYIVRLADGCSDPAFDTLNILVNPKVEVGLTTSPIKCYGELGFALVTPSTPDPYLIEWQTAPVRRNARIDAFVNARYYVTVINQRTGCRLDTSVVIPGYNKIQADFRTSPGGVNCLNPFDPILYVINQSVGGISGYWDFGDGTRIPYDKDINPTYKYQPDTNIYNITLWIENEGGCSDSAVVPVCVDDKVYVFVPNAFSPDGDGINDHYSILAANVTEINVQIYNRWGERVFESDQTDFSWDGTYQGEIVMDGLYKYIVKYKGKKTTWKLEHGVLSILR